MKLTSVSFILLAIVCLALFAVLAGCESEHGHHLNIPPHVSVTGGPPQGGETYYKVTISWVGWDEDGTIDYFLYAIDDTTHWTEIRQLEGTFLFSADSLREGEEFGRWHTFWVKAVDNDGAKSTADYVTFDAITVAPKTTITSPCDATQELCMGPISIGSTARITWRGVDPDCSCPDKKPVGYQWRLISLSGLLGSATPREDPAFLEHVMATTPENQPDTSSHWSEFSPDTEVVLTDLPSGAFYEFAVRAIDEAGAIEPGHSAYNQVMLTVMPGFGVPTLCVYENQAGHCFPADGPVWEYPAPINRTLAFSWQGDANHYGGAITGYRYGLDIQNLDDPSQWAIPWTANAQSTSVSFPEPGIHYLYVETIDFTETVTLATVKITVSEMFMDREVLYVDDYYDIAPTDLVHDNFMQAILTRCLFYTDSIYVFNCWLPGPGGIPREMPMMVDVPTLGELSRYKFIIWDTDASQNSFNTGLSGVIASGALQTYLNAGGRLWIYGNEIVRGSDPSPLSFAYGTVPDENTFAYQFLRISGVVNRPVISTSNRGDGFRRAMPNLAVSDLLPTLEIDYSKGGSATLYGLTKVEAVMTAMQDPDLSRRPDTLFFYGANLATSTYENKACGFRYHDVYSGWKTVYLGFSIHRFFESSAESLATFVTDWMLGDAVVSPKRAASR